MSIGRLSEVLDLTGTVADLSQRSDLAPNGRIQRIDLVTSYILDNLTQRPEPSHEGEYLMSLRIRTFLACLPSIKAVASGDPHTQEVSGEVFDNLMPVLEEAVTCNTYAFNGPRGGTSIHGQIAEMAVLGTILWANAKYPEKSSDSVTAASPNQDRSSTNGNRSGFDLLLRREEGLVKIQVKSSHVSDKVKKLGYYDTKPYREHIVIVYLTKLLHQESYGFGPQILADAVLRGDVEALWCAVDEIDQAIAANKASNRSLQTA